MDHNIVVKAYHESHSIVRHQIDSFDHFINVGLPNIVKTYGYIETQNYFVRLSNIKVKKPSLVDDGNCLVDILPHQCRLRNLTYASEVSVDVEYPLNKDQKIRKEVIIGKIPIMLRSERCHLYKKGEKEIVRAGECSLDPGGYFITKGTERVFLMQEQVAKNRMIIEKLKITKNGGTKIPLNEKFQDADIVCHVVSFTVENKSKTTIFKNNGYFYVQNSLFTESIPLFVMFAALNMPAHKDIFESVGVEYEMHNELICSVKESISLGIFSQRQALMWLIPKIKVALNRENKMTATPTSLEEEQLSLLMAKHELNRRVLNHVKGSDDQLWHRAKYLGMMVRRILLAEHGLIEPDDRDFYGTKRVELVGSYLGLAFEDRFQSMMGSMRMELEKTARAKKTNALDPCPMLRQSYITDGMFQCIFTGNWNFPRYGMNRTGVTQVLSRLSYISMLGHLCRICSQFEKVRKISGARAIHLSQYGLVCPADTPEGEACGLVKNLAFLVEITVDQPEDTIADLICSCPQFGDDDISTFAYRSGQHIVMLNGVPLGWTETPKAFGEQLRKLRRRGVLHEHVSIYYDDEMETLHVCCDGGRLTRPYIVVASGQSCLTAEMIASVGNGTVSWHDLIRHGIVEYLDAKEGYAECLVAIGANDLTQQHTHLDIDPSTALGVVASLIPFPHHNQSPRNTYQCAMGKQALGVISNNQRSRTDGTQHVLVSPQRPLTLSNIGRLIGYDQLPAGQNAIVAITCFGGHDIEDALIINKASLERGLFRSLTIKNFTDVLKENDNLGISTRKAMNQHALEADGTAVIGDFLNNGDVVIHKLTMPEKDPLATIDPTKPVTVGPKPAPTIYHGSERTQCTQVMFTKEDRGYTLVMVKTCQNRIPEVGDKLSSRHGQKGVIGRVVPMEEMPYTEDGMVPDIIMNPHGFPSRMTVGKLIELLANKSAVLDGQVRDSSSFSVAGHKSIDDDYPSVLLSNGYSSSGKEVFTCGTNGKIMEADIYTGPVYYQRLKHMVQDKVHARSTGKVQPLTRQPVVGRAQDGGLRVGEMERDCLIGYGATQILKERMLLSSDPYRVFVCEKCGLIATSKEWCQMCRSSQHVSSTIMPYATKLLLQELMTMQITPRLTLTRDETAVL